MSGSPPPSSPKIRNGSIYARGAVDDKGQFWMHVKALESMMVAGGGTLPVNVRVIIEGEEEVGGEGIAKFVREHGDRLKADVALVSDTDMFAPDLPTLCVGMRGMIYTEIEVHGARSDLHSGQFGGAAPNPFFGLSQIIAKLKDEDGRILVPGVYDKVLKPSDAELHAWKTLPFDEEAYREAQVGSPALPGEPGYSVLERLWSRPTLEVHGMPGGFIGAGAKTVIPGQGGRESQHAPGAGHDPDGNLRAAQELRGIHRSQRLHGRDPPHPLRRPVRRRHGKPVRRRGDGGPCARSSARTQSSCAAAAQSRSSVTSSACSRRRRWSWVFGLPDDNLHAPNEKFNLSNFHRGDRVHCALSGPGRRLSVAFELVPDWAGSHQPDPARGTVRGGFSAGRWAKFPHGHEQGAAAVSRRAAGCASASQAQEGFPGRSYRGRGAGSLLLSVNLIPDLYPGEGPLGGIVSALEQTPHEWNLFLAVDMPLLPVSALRMLLFSAGRALVTMAHADGRVQPLCGVYSRRALPVLRAELQQGNRRVRAAAEATGPVSYWQARQPSWFTNVNTPEEFAAAENFGTPSTPK